MPETITVEAIINAPLDAVWDGYTNPADIVQWNAASEDWHTTKAEVDLRVGGDFSSRMEAKDGSFGFEFAGTYTRVEPKVALAYVFGDRTAEISFREGLGGVTVQVQFDAETQNPIDMQRAGWKAILDNFKRHMESAEHLGDFWPTPMPHTPYHFYVHAHLPAWRLVRNGAEAWPLDAVAEDWVFTRARAGADTNADVRAMVDAQGYCLFRLGGTFADVAAELAALTQGD